MEYLEKGNKVWIILDFGGEIIVDEATVDMDFRDKTRVSRKVKEWATFTFLKSHDEVFPTEKEACEEAVRKLTDREAELEAYLDSTRQDLTSMKIRLKDLEFSEKNKGE